MKVYIDGSTTRVAVVFEDGRKMIVPIQKSTNNEGEYHALIVALEEIKKLGSDHFRILSDSELLVQQMGGWYAVKAKNLLPLWNKAQSMIASLRAENKSSVFVDWIPREQNLAGKLLE